MKISIIIGYYNRKKQLFFTLKTINQSSYKNIEIIIVDDCSDNPEDILYNSEFEIFNMDIKLITIKNEEKTWINPCVGYNKGISQSTGDIIILQNAEVCHIGDCIEYVVSNLQKNDWMTFNCYGLNNFEDNEYIYDQNNIKDIYEYINKLWLENDYTLRPGGNAAFTNKVGGWINHFLYHFVAYHYFGAIFRDDLMNKMNGGFDLDYANGICFDDNDFIKRLIVNNFKFKTNSFCESEPFVIHLFHEKPKYIIMDNLA
jgi:glycosyltransferase involved in cell wall biosynthesis